MTKKTGDKKIRTGTDPEKGRLKRALNFGFFSVEFISIVLQIDSFIIGDETYVYFWWGFALFAILIHNWIAELIEKDVKE